MGLDQTAKRITRLLQEDGRLSTAEIARRIDISEPTVRKKLAAMIGGGHVKIRAVAEPRELGYEAAAIIGLDVDRPRIKEVAQLLAGFPFVDSVAVTTGPYDILINACFETLSDLYDFVLNTLTEVEGIKDTHSFLVLQSFKTSGLIGVAGHHEASEGIEPGIGDGER